MKLSMKAGGQLIELDGRQMWMGLASEVPIGGGDTQLFRVRPQQLGRILALVVDRQTAERFELCDLRIGRNSQFLSSSPIPLALFATDVEGFPNMGELKFHDEKYRELVDLEACPVGCDVEFDVQNVSDKPTLFRGAVIWFVLDSPARER